eukprot:2168303-Rhodomonas_salina.4
MLCQQAQHTHTCSVSSGQRVASGEAGTLLASIKRLLLACSVLRIWQRHARYTSVLCAASCVGIEHSRASGGYLLFHRSPRLLLLIAAQPLSGPASAQGMQGAR